MTSSGHGPEKGIIAHSQKSPPWRESQESVPRVPPGGKKMEATPSGKVHKGGLMRSNKRTYMTKQQREFNVQIQNGLSTKSIS